MSQRTSGDDHLWLDSKKSASLIGSFSVATISFLINVCKLFTSLVKFSWPSVLDHTMVDFILIMRRSILLQSNKLVAEINFSFSKSIGRGCIAIRFSTSLFLSNCCFSLFLFLLKIRSLQSHHMMLFIPAALQAVVFGFKGSCFAFPLRFF